MKNFHAKIVDSFTFFPFRFFNSCVMNFESMPLGTYNFRFFSSFTDCSLFYHYEISHIVICNVLSLKFILSDITIAISFLILFIWYLF